MISTEHNIVSRDIRLQGLVLAGGKSVRMGTDKAQIIWHDKEQQYHLADLLRKFCSSVFISCKPGQETSIYNTYHTLPDSVKDLGPYGAILSAFENNSSCAWLVVACDLPLLDESTISYLIKNRNPQCIATTFKSPYDELPEPLITIWEPHSLKVLLSFLSQGISCPRKALINSDVKILIPPNPGALSNVNTPEEAIEARKIIKKMTTHA